MSASIWLNRTRVRDQRGEEVDAEHCCAADAGEEHVPDFLVEQIAFESALRDEKVGDTLDGLAGADARLRPLPCLLLRANGAWPAMT